MAIDTTVRVAPKSIGNPAAPEDPFSYRSERISKLLQQGRVLQLRPEWRSTVTEGTLPQLDQPGRSEVPINRVTLKMGNAPVEPGTKTAADAFGIQIANGGEKTFLLMCKNERII